MLLLPSDMIYDEQILNTKRKIHSKQSELQPLIIRVNVVFLCTYIKLIFTACLFTFSTLIIISRKAPTVQYRY